MAIGDRAGVLRAAAPLLLALAAVAVAALSGLHGRDLFGTPFEPYAYGFFLDRFPLLAPAIVYGAARIVLAAAEPGPRRVLRIGGALLGLLIFLAACLHPTFGGLVARAGYMVGSVAFMRSTPLPAAFAAGALAAAVVYGLALGLATAAARGRVRVGWRPFGRGLASLGALWWAAALLSAPSVLGLRVTEGFPAAPLSGEGAVKAAALVALALAPHALLARRATERKPREGFAMVTPGPPAYKGWDSTPFGGDLP